MPRPRPASPEAGSRRRSRAPPRSSAWPSSWPIPISLLAALFLFERSGKLAAALRFSADVLTGVPSIIIGIFAYAVLVLPLAPFLDAGGGLRARGADAADHDPGRRGGDADHRARPLGGGHRPRGATRAAWPAPSCCAGRSPTWSPATCWPSPGPWARPRPCCSPWPRRLAAMTLLIYTDGTQAVPERSADGMGDRPGAARLRPAAERRGADWSAWRISRRAH